jgi:hypothetical protein
MLVSTYESTSQSKTTLPRVRPFTAKKEKVLGMILMNVMKPELVKLSVML